MHDIATIDSRAGRGASTMVINRPSNSPFLAGVSEPDSVEDFIQEWSGMDAEDQGTSCRGAGAGSLLVSKVWKLFASAEDGPK